MCKIHHFPVQQGSLCAPIAGGEVKLLKVGGEINKNIFAHLKAVLVFGNS